MIKTLSKINWQKIAIRTIVVFCLFFLTVVPLLAGQTNCEPGKLCNPIESDNIAVLIKNILKIVAQLGAIVCVFFIIYAGFLYVTANGDPGKIKTAHSTFLWSVVGTAVLLGASVLAELICNTVSEILGGGKICS